jgi:DNA-binding MarR family transcriptional regulator
MDKLINQLAELLEDVMYDFSTHSLNNNCCENISHGEYRALRVVARLGKCTMREIARSIAVTKSGATRIITRLEEKKLVRRMHNQNDARICCVQLSKDGKSLLSRIMEEPSKKMTAVLHEMTPEMRQVLLIGLRTFAETAINKKTAADAPSKSSKVDRKITDKKIS